MLCRANLISTTTAKATTAKRGHVLTAPIQALTIRQKGDIEPGGDPKAAKEEVQGVFVVRGKNALFVAVKTGVTGVTDIEVKEGLSANDEIVTGSYKLLRNGHSKDRRNPSEHIQQDRSQGNRVGPRKRRS